MSAPLVTLNELEMGSNFIQRHIGNSEQQRNIMLAELNLEKLEDIAA